MCICVVMAFGGSRGLGLSERQHRKPVGGGDGQLSNDNQGINCLFLSDRLLVPEARCGVSFTKSSCLILHLVCSLPSTPGYPTWACQQASFHR